MSRLFAVALVGLAAAACSTSGAGPDVFEVGDTVLVSAAASLAGAFAAIETEFERANPGVDVVLNLAGSSALREQILEGAPADVFASANVANMTQVADAGAAARVPVVFARNTLQIAVPLGNPGGVTGLADFARDELFLGLCSEGVPCGDFAREALSAAGVSPAIDTNEPDVRALLTKIAAGELDAGITYVTDVAGEESVEGVAIPEAQNVFAEYPIAVLTGAPNPEAAAAFIAYVLSAEGRAILADFGFAAP